MNEEAAYQLYFERITGLLFEERRPWQPFAWLEEMPTELVVLLDRHVSTQYAIQVEEMVETASSDHHGIVLTPPPLPQSRGGERPVRPAKRRR